MRIKRYLLLALFFFALASIPYTANAQVPKLPELPEKDDSDRGNGGGTGPKSCSISPVDAYISVDKKSIEATVNANIGRVNVSIVDINGAEVYHKSIDTRVVNSLKVDISHLPANRYTIIFVNKQKEIIKSGYFDIE